MINVKLMRYVTTQVKSIRCTLNYIILIFVAGKVEKPRGNKTEMDYILEKIFDQNISEGISVHMCV